MLYYLVLPNCTRGVIFVGAPNNVSFVMGNKVKS